MSECRSVCKTAQQGRNKTTALEEPQHRITAIATFLVTASGISIAGIGSAFWGLLVGGLFMVWLGWRSAADRRQSAVEVPVAEPR